MLKVVTKYSYRDKTYTIVKHGEFYHAIDNDFINEGKLTCPLNGLQTFMSGDIYDCLTAVRNWCDYEFHAAHGYTKAQAICMAYGLDYRAEYESIFK